MKLTKKAWSLFSIIVLALSGLWIFLTSLQRMSINSGELLAAPRAGFMAPDFRLETNDGDTIGLEDFRGYVILLNFWGSYCQPCKTEMPYMQSLYEEYSDSDFIVLAVDAPGDEGSAVEFVDVQQLTFPILFDSDGKVSGSYRVRALPTTFMIDRHGVIQEVMVGGPVNAGILRTNITQLMED